MTQSHPERQRVLICAPFGRDAELSATVLGKAGLSCVICKGMLEVADALALGAGALLTVEEMVVPSRAAPLEAFLAQQATWSDLPILVLTRAANAQYWGQHAYRRLRNLTLLESPILPSTLVSAVRAAVRARGRQYEVFDAEQRKDEFLAMLGHELRNPLAPIGAAAQLLHVAAADAEKVRRTSQIIARQVKHMTSLIDDLLDMARVTRGLITLDRETIDIQLILTEAIEQVEPLRQERHHALELEISPQTMNVEGDRKRLVQVFANLLQNAVKYTPPGGQIKVLAHARDHQAWVEISDNGIGMTPDVVKHVFDLFSQAERSADRSQGGLGLGLSLVDSLISSHGGEVEAWSAGLGKGSVFTVRLPLVDVEDAPLHALRPNAAGEQVGASLYAMVVDDNQDAADTLAMLLEETGYRVSVCYSAAAALEQARQIRPQVFLLDIGLPDMNGNDLARQLRKIPECAHATLIAVTGYGQQEDRDHSQQAGFDYHFVKPLDLDSLATTLAVLSGATPPHH